MITAEQLIKIMPQSKPIAVEACKLLNVLFPKYGITTVDQISSFIAQTGHESSGFTRLVENLNYSDQGLANTWPKRFSTGKKHLVGGKSVNQPNDLAISLSRNQEAIANSVYSNRLGNGSAESGDGWKYRGRGAMQTTGKFNYQRVKDSTGWDVINSPEMLGELDKALEAALIFWKENNLNRFVEVDDFTGLTKAINGGVIGLADRVHVLNKAREALA